MDPDLLAAQLGLVAVGALLGSRSGVAGKVAGRQRAFARRFLCDRLALQSQANEDARKDRPVLSLTEILLSGWRCNHW